MAASPAVCVLLVGAALATSAAAQTPSPAPPVEAIPRSGARPLRKTDLIRMLSSGPMSNKQIALAVRRNCLSFTPSERDRLDIVQSSADTAVMNAVAECGQPGGTLHFVVPAVVRAMTGTEVVIPVSVLRWDVPVSGVLVVLAGATHIPGGPTQNPGAATDARGVARLRLPVGTEPMTRTLRVMLGSGSEYPRATVEIVTASRAVARAEVRPAVLVLRSGMRSAASIDVSLFDARGRPVAGVPVELQGTTAQLSPVDGPPTDAQGHTTLELPSDSVQGGGQAGVYVGGQMMGGITLLFQPLIISEDRTQFVAGTDQRGTVHSVARSPLVLEVRDTSGRPVPGYPVRFGVVNGDVSPASTVTDSVGMAAVHVTLGDRAGTVVVTANVGSIARQALLFAAPASAQSLEVLQGGRSVSIVTVTSRDTVVLRAVTRDAYGNDVPISGLTPVLTGRAVLVRQPRMGVPGTVVLVPQKTGSATLSVQGEGQKSDILIDVRLPPIVTGPWWFGARAGGVAFNYDFRTLSFIQGRPGFRSEVVGGREVAPGLRIEGGVGLGVLGAEAHSANLSVGLFQGLVRGEYALTRSESVVPVVSLGGGVYRIKSTDPTNTVYHTSWLYLFGAGADFPLGNPKMWGVARLERQQLVEANSKFVNGAVGALTVVEVGIRVTP